MLDYIQEPDVFHDVFGHVPLLADPTFAKYMEEYGKGGLKAAGLGMTHKIARLYWYTVCAFTARAFCLHPRNLFLRLKAIHRTASGLT